MAWPHAPRALHYLIAPLLTLSAIPYYLLGLILVYLFAIEQRLFPLSGGYTDRHDPDVQPAFVVDVVHHAILPALSIVLAAIGFWALGMRGMMVTTEGEDYMILAEAKGLPDRLIFFRYAAAQRDPAAVHVAGDRAGHGRVGRGAGRGRVRLPGIGTLLYQAISGSDYFVIYGVVFIIVLAIALATLIIDLVYPLLDPRISYRKAYEHGRHRSTAAPLVAPRQRADAAAQSVAGVLPAQPESGGRPGAGGRADLIGLIGPLFVDVDNAVRPSTIPDQPPSSDLRSAATTRAATCWRCWSPACR